VMTAEHGRMPNFALTRPEMNDLAAYIMSLRAPPK
jgi:mono/diheme cytochrome c family protein